MPDVVSVEIESLTPQGDGIGRHGRLRLVVPFTIPGELVRARWTGVPDMGRTSSGWRR